MAFVVLDKTYTPNGKSRYIQFGDECGTLGRHLAMLGPRHLVMILEAAFLALQIVGSFTKTCWHYSIDSVGECAAMRTSVSGASFESLL